VGLLPESFAVYTVTMSMKTLCERRRQMLAVVDIA